MWKSYSLFLVHPLHAVSQTKNVCVVEHKCVCALTRTYITCTSTNYVDVPDIVQYHPRGRGRSNS